jgi:hypothetical protein
MSEPAMGTRSVWQEEYRRSLKAVETEEPLDLLIYRPLAFCVAKLFARTTVSANQVSLASLAFGVLTGALLWQGSPKMAALAAGSYFLCNVLDCADGQLARMKGPSPLGYIVDGSIDYLATFAVFLGMGHSMALRHPESAERWWLISVAWLCSFGFQCALLDRKRHEWMSRVHKRRSSPEKEIVEFRRQAEAWRREGSNLGGRALIALYLFYKVSWARILPRAREADPADEGDVALWAEKHRPVLRMAVMMGSTMQMTLIMIAALAFRIDLLLWTTLTLGNVWGALVLLLERRAAQQTAESATKGK